MVKITKIKELDFSKEYNINQLVATPIRIKDYYENFKKILPQGTQEPEIWRKVNNMLVKDTLFTTAMNIALESYKVDFEESDLVQIMNNLRENVEYLKPAPDAYVASLARAELEKSAIVKELAKEWNITISDDEANKILENYYKTTNNSIHDIKSNKANFENFKSQLLFDKTISVMISKVKAVFDWPAIEKQITGSSSTSNPIEEK